MNEEESIDEIMLSQSIRELFYAFQKNGGSLDYCVEQIRQDFKNAGYSVSTPATEAGGRRVK